MKMGTVMNCSLQVQIKFEFTKSDLKEEYPSKFHICEKLHRYNIIPLQFNDFLCSNYFSMHANFYLSWQTLLVEYQQQPLWHRFIWLIKIAAYFWSISLSLLRNLSKFNQGDIAKDIARASTNATETASTFSDVDLIHTAPISQLYDALKMEQDNWIVTTLVTVYCVQKNIGVVAVVEASSKRAIIPKSKLKCLFWTF